MAISSTLRARAVSLTVPPAPSPPLGGGGPVEHRIGVFGEDQQGLNWCWAAVAVSLRNFQRPAEPMTQCELAQKHLQRADCCGPEPPGNCDKPSYLERALRDAEVQVHGTPFKGVMALGDLLFRLRARKPVCCAIRWPAPDPTYHFIQIDGFTVGGPRGIELLINDPISTLATTTYDALVNGEYPGNGRWRWTYLIS